MKLFATILVIADLLLFFPSADASEVWLLVHSEFHAPSWYCTYQLQGSTALTTVIVPPSTPQQNYCPVTFSKRTAFQ